jgi:uncharacterized DUF497 family protein
VTRIDKLVWDDWNKAHIAVHGVIEQEVTEVCRGNVLVGHAHSGRIAVIGETRALRILTVILHPKHERGVYYPVTARPASRKERREYARWKEGEKAA